MVLPMSRQKMDFVLAAEIPCEWRIATEFWVQARENVVNFGLRWFSREKHSREEHKHWTSPIAEKKTKQSQLNAKQKLISQIYMCFPCVYSIGMECYNSKS